MKNKIDLLFAALIMLLPGAAWAADAMEGERFARRVCSTCHSIAAGPLPMAAAPPFVSIARSKQFRIQGSGLMFKSHPIMPNFAFTNEQAEDLAAYLKSLARRRVGFQPDACDPSKASLLDVHQTCFGKGRLSSFGM